MCHGKNEQHIFEHNDRIEYMECVCVHCEDACVSVFHSFGEKTNPYQNGNERILTSVYFTSDLCHALARSILVMMMVVCACHFQTGGRDTTKI